jgi:hypothetical protein
VKSNKIIKIGGASGYWGESAMATPQLLASGDLDYLVYDYLAEITMSIMARAKAKDPSRGYATDFIDFVMKPFLPMIAEKGVKIISNAGGVNPMACAEVVRELIKEKKLNLKVAVITGDDLLDQKDVIAAEQPTDMFGETPFPDSDKIASINVYLGAFPIAKALAAGADIVITGRCVDSAVTLGACIHEFGWEPSDLDLLASGSLAGHILECGPQATGGNFTDWQDAGDIANIGYPIAEIKSDGSFITTKPEGTGGIVNVGTVSEQMLYEIGDPRDYILPDVVCDFSQVQISQLAENRVQVTPAIGYSAPHTYKTCLTYMDGFRAGTYLTLYGANADKKAQKLADAAYERANKTMRLFNLGEFTEFNLEILGTGSQSGISYPSNEVVMKLAVKHPDVRGTGIFLKELAGLGLATPPGLSGFTGAGRARPSPVVRLFSYKTDKQPITIKIDVDGDAQTFNDHIERDSQKLPNGTFASKLPTDATIGVPLIKLAWGRSGDKGDKANIGIIAREPEYLPYIWAALTEEKVSEVYAHFMETPGATERFLMPGCNAINFLIDNILGGGGAASLRNDAQGKGYAQILLAQSIPVSKSIAEAL